MHPRIAARREMVVVQHELGAEFNARSRKIRRLKRSGFGLLALTLVSGGNPFFLWGSMACFGGVLLHCFNGLSVSLRKGVVVPPPAQPAKLLQLPAPSRRP